MRRHEPNLRQLDNRLPDLQRRAGLYAGKWEARGAQVRTSDGTVIATALDEETACYLKDLHTHFLPVLNQLHYALRGAADLKGNT
jgi:hypothetical protein